MNNYQSTENMFEVVYDCNEHKNKKVHVLHNLLMYCTALLS